MQMRTKQGSVYLHASVTTPGKQAITLFILDGNKMSDKEGRREKSGKEKTNKEVAEREEKKIGRPGLRFEPLQRGSKKKHNHMYGVGQ